MKIFNASFWGFIGVTATLSGCTSVETLRPDVEARLLPSRLDEIAYINTLREAYIFTTEEGCYNGDDNYFRSDLAQGYQDHTREQEGLPKGKSSEDDQCVTFSATSPDEVTKSNQIRRYLDAGYGLSSIYCQRFFIVANQASLKRDFQRNGFNSIDTLVGSILALTSTGETALGIVNGGFGAIDTTYQNLDEAFLVAPELGSVQELVVAAQTQHANNTYATMPQNFLAARRNIEDYARYCTYTGMQSLVTKSLENLTEDAARGKAQISNIAPPDGG